MSDAVPQQILVVDDDPTARILMQASLQQAGFVVQVAADAQEALQLFHGASFDLVMSDVEMPGMDGFEVLSKLRLSDALRHLPVIMITSRTGDKHRERALSLGANMYLGKPYQESVLLEHIGRLLGRGRLRAGS